MAHDRGGHPDRSRLNAVLHAGYAARDGPLSAAARCVGSRQPVKRSLALALYGRTNTREAAVSAHLELTITVLNETLCAPKDSLAALILTLNVPPFACACFSV